ncbi:MAG: DegV family protein [Candidatus Dormibacteraeota bacterium]|nr:DegV family protein [Candidatus Dormibacteraeota bacterium]
MPGVQIVCDSTADLEPPFRDAHGVRVVPLKVIFGEQVLEDGVSVLPDELYRRMRAGEKARTSQPTPAEFEAAYRSVPVGTAIVCTTISADLSGTFASAEQARAAVPDREITVVDTRTAAVGHNAVVHAAVAAAEATGLADAVLKAVRTVMASQRLLFTVETLEYLRRGGRIGAARALVGSMLDIKPILEVKDGVIEPVDRVRTFNRALDRIFATAGEAVAAWGGGVITVGQAGRPDLTADLVRRATAAAPKAEVRPVEVGPVIGVHGGPGAVGLSFHPPL